jgi:type III restriction enzyme
MGLRAFSSQLLCEQVVGRGLRRTSYEVNPETGLFEPEYVNIFGVPFTFLPHEGGDGPPPPPPSAKTRIEPLPQRQSYEISWPNIIRLDHTYRPRLSLDPAAVKPLVLDAHQTTTLTELAPIVEGKPDFSKIATVDLEELGHKFRRQKIIFETARDIYDQMQPTWPGSQAHLLAQLIRLVEQFIGGDNIRINPPAYQQDELKRRIVITLNMNKIVQHIWEAIRFANTEALVPVFDSDFPIRSSGDVQPWYTSKACHPTQRSHLNQCVFDSTWEASEAFTLDHQPQVAAWVKNDHLGFEILYLYQGIVRKYRPDFLIRLADGSMLILETKGQDSQQDRTKREFLAEWVTAVNQHGGFGRWAWAVSRHPDDVAGILEEVCE